MTLDQYLRDNDMTNAAFGRLIGVAGETIRRYRNGTRWPDRETMAAIYEATRHEVSANDFMKEAA
jgi:transcriptional regulator with XRE-family HTH domain